MTEQTSSPRTLAIDIGGSGVKVMVLDQNGTPLTDRDRRDTPQPPVPEQVIATIIDLTADKTFDRVSVGFPGVVKQGCILTAVNLTNDWIDLDLVHELEQRLHRPVRVINDADMQGLGAITGQGLEVVITLGTGFGSALFMNGKLVPNLELGHHPFRKGQTYEEQLGRKALDDIGKQRWNSRLSKAISTLSRTFNYDTLYIGGGNTKYITTTLPVTVKVVPNVAGLLGGIALWKD
jgi:polyphosphate glucokinase